MATPVKRHHEEYHDPDYPQDDQPDDDDDEDDDDPDEDDHAGPSFATKRPKLEPDSVPERKSSSFASVGESIAAGVSASASASAALTPDERLEAIRAVIRREFAREKAAAEGQLELIDERLAKAKRLLHRVRYSVVRDYYNNQRQVYSEQELRSDLAVPAEGDETPVLDGSAPTEPPKQAAIHPSLKKLLGTSEIDYNEILKVRSPRQAAKDAKNSISEKLRTKREERRQRMAEADAAAAAAANAGEQTRLKVPRYVSPIKAGVIEPRIAQLNNARGAMRNATRCLMAVGNTSKYIGDDAAGADPMTSVAENGGVTHKWLVYVRCKVPADRPIEQMLQKVRFFLHPSYRPNDVVDVSSAPFQIARRGWGEFPVRVQLFFREQVQQKPLQIFHQLVLDQKRTGLQTMGAETLVEMWLQLPVIAPVPEQKAMKAELRIKEELMGGKELKVKTEPAITVNAAAKTERVATPFDDIPELLMSDEAPDKPAALPNMDDLLGDAPASASEPCLDVDGLINSVQISEAEQHSLLAMTEESKRFADDMQLLSSPPITAISSLRRNGDGLPETLAQPLTTSVRPLNERLAAMAVVPAEKKVAAHSIRDRLAAESAPNAPTVNSDAIVPAASPEKPPVIKLNATSPAKTTTATTANSIQTTSATIDQPKPPVVQKTFRKFVKCLNPEGKVVIVEVQTDPNNPKNLLIVRNGAVHPFVPSTAATSSSNAAPVKPLPLPLSALNPRAILPPTSSATSSASAADNPAPRKPMVVKAGCTIPSPTASAGQTGRMIVLPKSGIATPPQNGLSASAVKLLPTITNGSATHSPIKLLKKLVPVSQASALAQQNLTPGAASQAQTKRVIMRNGQMFIIDPSKIVGRAIPASSASARPPLATALAKPAATPAKPKQQSLLKPQISLLKPRPPPATSVASPPKRAAIASPLAVRAPLAAVPANLKFAMKLPLTASPTGRVIRPPVAGQSPPIHKPIRTLVPLIRASPGGPFVRMAGPRPPLTNGAFVHRSTAVVPLRQLTPIRLPAEKSLFSSHKTGSQQPDRKLVAPPPIDPRADFERRFVARQFHTVRAAVEFLLHNVPQVHRLVASSPAYAHAFPFCLESERQFDAFDWLKQRSLEWLRAKFVERLLVKTRLVGSDAPLADVWTTKEIVLFARRFGFALPMRSPADGRDTRKTDDKSGSTLSKLIKREIERVEGEDAEPTLSSAVRVTSWMDAWHARRQRRKRSNGALVEEGSEFVDVIGVGDEKSTGKSKANAPADGKRKPRGLYPLPPAVRTEAGWVADVCAQVHVKLQPEEIVEDILHPSAQLVLVTAVHSFLTDLAHRAYASKSDADRDGSSAVDRQLKGDDLRSAITATAHFDFLTNRHLGGVSTTAATATKSDAPAAKRRKSDKSQQAIKQENH